MAIDPGTINLSPEQRRRLAELADRTGRPWSDVLDDALRSAPPSNGNENLTLGTRSFFDVLLQDGAIGVVKESLASDLSTNPKHMEGFGRDRHEGSD